MEDLSLPSDRLLQEQQNQSAVAVDHVACKTLSLARAILKMSAQPSCRLSAYAFNEPENQFNFSRGPLQIVIYTLSPPAADRVSYCHIDKTCHRPLSPSAAVKDLGRGSGDGRVSS